MTNVIPIRNDDFVEVARAWRVKISAVWRDEVLPHPVSSVAKSKALSQGVRIECEPDRYIARFSVSSDGLFNASRLALAKWVAIVETAELPDWELVGFEVAEIDPKLSSL